MMRRDEVLKILARHVGDDIVVPVYTTAFDWIAIRPHPLNYLCVGAMGLAPSHALGLALGRPDKRVLVFDGDGSLLMNLGCLVSIAEAAPRNLVHLVFENGTYEANGAHPIPGRDRIDFAGFARAAGYRNCHTFDDLTALERNVAALLRADGPTFIVLKVEPGPPPVYDYKLMHSEKLRSDFKTALNA